MCYYKEIRNNGKGWWSWYPVVQNGKFLNTYKLEIDQIYEDIKETDKEFKILLEAATHSRSESKGRIPWWTEECGEAVKAKNKALRKLKTTQNLIIYEQAQG